MWLSSILASRRSGSVRARPARRPASRQLMVERLEDRTLPSFLGPVSYLDRYGARTLAVGDFDKDGTPDLAVLGGNNSALGGNYVNILLGKGNGTFQPAGNFVTDPNGYSQSVAIAVGDFNGDGKLDIVTANSETNGGTVSVLLGNGDGTFQSPRLYVLPREPISPGTQFPVSLAVGDFNKDGKLDVVVTASDGVNVTGSAYVNVLIGTGAGGFSADNSYLLPSGPPLWAVAVGDFNGDGNLDLALTDIGYVSVMIGNGDGTFGAGPVSYAGGDYAGLVVADFNGDGKLDLVTPYYDAGATVSVVLGNGDGTFGSPTSYFVGGNPNSVAVADFDRDGTLDLAVPNNLGLTVLLGKGDGTFRTDFTYYAGFAPQSVVAADFNRDGWPDLALVNGGDTNTISMFFNLADWSSTPKAAQFVISAPANVSAGVPFSLTVTALDAYGNVVTGYTGTIHFSSTDTKAGLPADYTFTAADRGVHTFTGVVLRKKGYQHLTITDSLNMFLTGSVIVDVL